MFNKVTKQVLVSILFLLVMVLSGTFVVIVVNFNNKQTVVNETYELECVRSETQTRTSIVFVGKILFPIKKQVEVCTEYERKF